ncbi:MAG: hypothetical protein ACXQTW_03240 [Candidatus Methanospirareceae archaeon]
MKVRTLNEIRKRGIEALAKALGPIGMVRFIQSFDLGKGDYTKERFQWLEQDMDEIIDEIERKRTRSKGSE